MKRSKYRATKILTGEPLQEVSVKPLAVILTEVPPGKTLKVILHSEPFGECVCLSEFRSGRELTRCHPSMPPLSNILNVHGQADDRAAWIEVGKAFLEEHLKSYAPGQWAKTLDSLASEPALNGSS
ncbi:hypothetical protein [Pseudomonas sp. NUPR-001]|uniref:hypothetical protein n=1 Tax=Pseudomonas sp. NUPR-001 TaxID=3416058 RepID=UPI003F99B5E4